MATGKETAVPPFLPSSNVMTNGYFGGVTMETANLNYVQVDHVEQVASIRRSVDLGCVKTTTIDNDDPKSKYKEPDEELLRNPEPNYKDMSSQMKEYYINYNGLVIIPWDEFSENPRKLNDLFYLERNGQITYDPDDVNVFFHATKMNKPTFGDISEQGNSWVINVETIKDLEQVRVWLIERVSVFGVTLLRKTSRFGKSDKAPCLVMLDPAMGHGDTIHATIMRCINVMQQGKKFCLQIDLNGCVERWCRRITMTKCEAVGAKLVVTNGEEPATFTDAENVVCCIVCFPIWSIQAGIYKVHRHAQYKDFELKFDAEELFLYGTLGGVRSQRAKLFREYQKEIFRTKPIEEAGQEFQGRSVERNKYISEKKIKTRENYQNGGNLYTENETRGTKNMFTKDNDYILDKISVRSTGTRVPETTTESFSNNNSEKSINRVKTENETKLPINSVSYNFLASKEKLGLNLDSRENTSSSDFTGPKTDFKDEKKMKSLLEVESCTMRKELSPIQSARTVNSDIMIITESNGEESQTGSGSEIDLRTFLRTELSPPPAKPKNKSRKHKKGSKPPKSPTKKNKQKSGIENSAFDFDSENKFRRMLPSKRRSLESLETIDTRELDEKIEKESVTETFDTRSRDSLDTVLDSHDSNPNPNSDNEVISLNPVDVNDDDVRSHADDTDIESDVNLCAKVFEMNNKINKHEHIMENGVENNVTEFTGNVKQSDDMSCDDLEFSDYEEDNNENQKADDENDKKEDIPKTSNKRQHHIRGTAQYRSNRQKYIGMNTSLTNGRLPPLKMK